jgi:hypothetical protein
MGEIIPDIVKSKHMPRTLCWPIQYSHLEAAFTGRCVEDLRLSVHFGDKPVLFSSDSKAARRLATRWGFKMAPLGRRTLLIVEYDPDYRGFFNADANYRLTVRATVYPLPVATLRASGLTKARVREILVAQLHELTPPRLPSDRWCFHLGLGPQEYTIECIAVNWNGNREGEPVRTLVPFNKREPGGEVQG